MVLLTATELLDKFHPLDKIGLTRSIRADNKAVLQDWIEQLLTTVDVTGVERALRVRIQADFASCAERSIVLKDNFM
jgi:hypothetical protein